MDTVYFNIPFVCSDSAENVANLIKNPSTVNHGVYLKKCKEWMEVQWPAHTAFMTTSCTRAMELISLSMNIQEGDEIILSPFTYVGVGNAFANYGAKLVFVDIDASTMNIDASFIEDAITPKTRAVIAMHYAGIPCEMEKIKNICEKYNLILIEDNAQGMQSMYQNQLLGSFGDFSCISFDTLKNISCNEGGVLLCKNEFIDAVDVAYNNGTNRTAYLNGKVDKYEWSAKGSKFTMSEYTAAVLHPLLVKSETVIDERKKIWNSLFQKISAVDILRKYIPPILLDAEHNGHIAYLKFDDETQRNKVMSFLNTNGVSCSFHYVPLDDSSEGKNNTQSLNVCQNSLKQSKRLLRLPIHNYLTETEQQKIVDTLIAALS